MAPRRGAYTYLILAARILPGNLFRGGGVLNTHSPLWYEQKWLAAIQLKQVESTRTICQLQTAPMEMLRWEEGICSMTAYVGRRDRHRLREGRKVEFKSPRR